jgi:hypothetical protein
MVRNVSIIRRSSLIEPPEQLCRKTDVQVDQVRLDWTSGQVLCALAAHIRITDLTGTDPAVSLLALGVTTFALAIARW